MKFKTVKAFWRLRNKIFLEGKKSKEKESASLDVIITEVTPSAEPSTREQRATSRKSMKKMARKHSKGKKKTKVIEIEEIPDDGITESEVVVTPEELKAAREEVVEPEQKEQGMEDVSAGTPYIRNLHLIDKDDDIEYLGVRGEYEGLEQVEKENTGNPA